MGPFELHLRGHDWYYQYSDDHQAWIDGKESLRALHETIARMACPFSLEDLRKWAQGMASEQWSDDPAHPGMCLRTHGPRGEQAAPKDALLAPGVSQQITKWFTTHDLVQA